MEQAVLRKLQMTQLEIAREIKRVCEENCISFFLNGGSLLGAVRHQGFVPWDDDMDVGMLREDYERFCAIAQEKLGKDFVLQSWYTDRDYALPFAKVMKRGTLYLSSKSHRLAGENGIYVDVFPFDRVPENPEQRRRLGKKLLKLYRIKRMLCKDRPWMEWDRVVLKKRVGYLYYQMLALFASGEQICRRYDALARGAEQGSLVCEQSAQTIPRYYRLSWFQNLTDYEFEGVFFPGPRDYDAVLQIMFGEYTRLPPEEKRTGSHQITQLHFGEGEGS